MNLVWFRSDLRIHDNPALYNACIDNEQVSAIFIVTLQQWQMHDWGNNKIGFVLKSVLQLQESLHQLNINLQILYCATFLEVPELLLKYARTNKATTLFYNKEYELNETIRDKNVTAKLEASGINSSVHEDQCLIAPGLVVNKQGLPYSIFTPFKKASYLLLQQTPVNILPLVKKRKDHISMPKVLSKELSNYINNPILNLWPAGEKHALKLLREFCAKQLSTYKTNRDFPVLSATSCLSPYLAVGSISVRKCMQMAMEEGLNAGVLTWVDELLWRDFYRNVIFHNPRICKGENYNTKYNKIKWNNNHNDFLRWSNAETGVPIIDAAMRQLVQTGWMHNRLRMIVAMFLTKQLLIDWRLGEKFFSQHLVDLDFASNNGGWQWCASTGTDAVPYFRIFNPITQSIKFDPQGLFIRQYCKELAKLSTKQIHDPSAYCTEDELRSMSYAEIIVDLKKARLVAMAAYKL